MMLSLQKQASLGRPSQASRTRSVTCKATLPNVQEARDWIARFKSKQQGGSSSPTKQAAAPSAPSSNGRPTMKDEPVISFTAQQLQDPKAGAAALAKIKATA